MTRYEYVQKKREREKWLDEYRRAARVARIQIIVVSLVSTGLLCLI